MSGNSVAYAGGGLANLGGVVTLTDVTLSGNSSGSDSGGIFQPGGPSQTVALSSSILVTGALGANCAIGNGAGPIVSNGHNRCSDLSCTPFFGQTGDLTTTNPNLGLLVDNGGPTLTHLPKVPSPAIDAIPAGVNGYGPPLTGDQRGAPRPINGKCDIGAVEAAWLRTAFWLPQIRR